MGVGANDIDAMQTIGDYIYGCVAFDVPNSAAVFVARKAGIESIDEPIDDIDEATLKKCEAYLYLWISTSPYKKGSKTDKDNDWSHSDGGYTLTEADRKYYLKLANGIFEELGMPKVAEAKYRVRDFGIKKSNRPYICGFNHIKNV